MIIMSKPVLERMPEARFREYCQDVTRELMRRHRRVDDDLTFNELALVSALRAERARRGIQLEIDYGSESA